MARLNLNEKGWQILRDLREPNMPEFRVFLHSTGAVRVWFEGMKPYERTWWRARSSHPLHPDRSVWTKTGTSVAGLATEEVSAEEGLPYAREAWPYYLEWKKGRKRKSHEA